MRNPYVRKPYDRWGMPRDPFHSSPESLFDEETTTTTTTTTTTSTSTSTTTTTTTTSAPTYADVVLADSPLMYLRLGEASGETANDETMNENDGTYVGTLLREQTGLIDDVDTCVEIEHALDGYVQSPAFTSTAIKAVEMWLTNGVGEDAYEPWWSLVLGSLSLALYWHGFEEKLAIWEYGGAGDNIYYSDVIADSVGTFHIVIFYNTTDDKTYCMVNGVVSESTFSGNMFANYTGATLFAGCDHNGSAVADTLVGKLDEIVVYSTEVSAERFLQHYQIGAV